MGVTVLQDMVNVGRARLHVLPRLVCAGFRSSATAQPAFANMIKDRVPPSVE